MNSHPFALRSAIAFELVPETFTIQELRTVHEAISSERDKIMAQYKFFAKDKIPDGVYKTESATDDDGSRFDIPVWVRCTLTVKGASNRGTPTTDTYALAGFAQAYKAINEACGKK